jgi:hypothetical protein
MASLAIDSFGNLFIKDIFVRAGDGGLPQRGIGVMAGHALEDDRTAEVLLSWVVVAWAHLPISTHFAVPAHGEFNQFSFTCAVQVRMCVIARSNHIVDLHLFVVRLFPLKADLMALLIQLAIPFDHRVVAV